MANVYRSRVRALFRLWEGPQADSVPGPSAMTATTKGLLGPGTLPFSQGKIFNMCFSHNNITNPYSTIVFFSNTNYDCYFCSNSVLTAALVAVRTCVLTPMLKDC